MRHIPPGSRFELMFTRKGVLITCDVPMKQLIKHLDPNKNFIIYDLDETHVFVDANFVGDIKRQIREFTDKHVYQPEEEEQQKRGRGR